MKCTSCGAETQGKFCEFCGSELPQEKSNVTITNNYYGGTMPSEHNDGDANLGKCPKCGNSKIKFDREQTAITTKASSKQKIMSSKQKGKSVSQSEYKTIALCQNCGYTWNPNDKNGKHTVSSANTGDSKKWLWICGWIFCFPIPLTILLAKNKHMKPAIKYALIAALWIAVLAIGSLSGNTQDDTAQTDPASQIEFTQNEQATDETSTDEETTDNESATFTNFITTGNTQYTIVISKNEMIKI